MTLTEQWKKGELEDGFYYVEEEGKTFISICHKHHLLQVLQDCKVLAPVPTFNEWQQLVQDYSDKHDKYLRLSQTNHQLHKFCEEFNALDVAKENEQLKLIIKRTKASGNYPGRVSAYKARIIHLSEENQQLKELLRECQEYIVNTPVYPQGDEWKQKQIHRLLDKITSATGEN